MKNKVKKVSVMIEKKWIDLFNVSADKNLVPDINTTIEQCVHDLYVFKVQKIMDLTYSSEFRPIPADIFTDAIRHPRIDKSLVSVTINQHYRHNEIVEYLDAATGMELADYVNTAIKLIALTFYENAIPQEVSEVQNEFTDEEKLEAEILVDDIYFMAGILNSNKANMIKKLSESSVDYKRPVELSKELQDKLDLVVEAGETDLFKDYMNSCLCEQIVDTIFNAYDNSEYLALMKTPMVLYLDVRKVEGNNNIYLFVVDSTINDRFTTGVHTNSKMSVENLINNIIKISLDFTIRTIEEKVTDVINNNPIDMRTLQKMLQYVIATALRIERGSNLN
ncbi:MAG: hypothetical protein C0602_05965 [Denitrovibrio sp.]|nr:MAG: hypothetical protein C0602_05965 [Denitrovibrio sp.]